MRVLHVHGVAYVGETLVKWLNRAGVEASFVEEAVRADVERCDIVHAHYALNRKTIRAVRLANKIGKKVVLHHHGSDVRLVTSSGMRPLPFHYSAISKWVRRRAASVILATPDLTAFSEGEYVPNPVDIEVFKPMGVPKSERVLICGRQVRGSSLLKFIDSRREYDIINTGEPINLPANLRPLPMVPRERFPEFLNGYREMIGAIGDLVTMSRLEAMACGLRTFSDFDERFVKYYGGENPDKVAEPRAFVEKYHDPSISAKRVIGIYEALQ